jgi:hypothetical protein
VALVGLNLSDTEMAKKKSPTGPTEPPISPELRKQLSAQKGLRRLRGKVKWVGDLAQMREGRLPAWQDGIPNAER